MTKAILLAALLLSALPALAQPKPLTPPEVLGAAKTIQFTATLYKIGDPAAFYLLGSNKTPIQISSAVLALPNKAYAVDTNAKTKAIETVYASDGITQTEYLASHQQSVKSAAPAQITAIKFRTFSLSVFADCFTVETFAKFKDAGAVGVEEKPLNHYYLLALGIVNKTQMYEAIAVDHKTGLPLFVSFSVAAKEPDDWGPGTHDGSREVERVEFSHWKLNAPVDNSQFVYTPPVGGIRN